MQRYSWICMNVAHTSPHILRTKPQFSIFVFMNHLHTSQFKAIEWWIKVNAAGKYVAEGKQLHLITTTIWRLQLLVSTHWNQNHTSFSKENRIDCREGKNVVTKTKSSQNSKLTQFPLWTANVNEINTWVKSKMNQMKSIALHCQSQRQNMTSSSPSGLCSQLSMLTLTR